MPKSKRKKRSRFIKKKQDDAVKLIMKSNLGIALTDFNEFLTIILNYLRKFNKNAFDNIEREDLTPIQEKESYLAIQKAAAYYLMNHISFKLAGPPPPPPYGQMRGPKWDKFYKKNYKKSLTRAFQRFRDPREFPIELLPRIGNTKESGFSNFLNSVFRIKMNWRNMLEQPINSNIAAKQCFEVLRLFHPPRETGETQREYINRVKENEARGLRRPNWFEEWSFPDKYREIFQPGKCYICNSSLRTGSPLQCEHILPMFSALSHIWFWQGPIENSRYTSSISEIVLLRHLLILEYEWSHACCNVLKSNLPFILFKNGKCQFNNEVANRLLEAIRQKTSSAFDADRGHCNDLGIYKTLNEDIRNIDSSTGFGYKKIISNISKRVQPLIEIINTTIDRNFSSIPPPQMPAKRNEWKRKLSNIYFSKFTRMNIYIAWSKLRALAMFDDDQFQQLINKLPVERRAAELIESMRGGGLTQPDQKFDNEIFISMVLTFGIPSLNIEPYMIGFTNDSEMLVKGYGTPNTFLNISTSINENRFHNHILSLRPLMDNIETATEEEKQKILYEVANKPEILSQTPDMSLSSDPMEISSSKNNSLDLGSYPLSENIYNNSNIQSTPDDYLTKTIKQSPFTTTPSTRRRSPHSTSQRISRVYGGKKKKKRTRKKRRKRKKKTRRKKS